jgi:hypothetical protein
MALVFILPSNNYILKFLDNSASSESGSNDEEERLLSKSDKDIRKGDDLEFLDSKTEMGQLMLIGKKNTSYKRMNNRAEN